MDQYYLLNSVKRLLNKMLYMVGSYLIFGQVYVHIIIFGLADWFMQHFVRKAHEKKGAFTRIFMGTHVNLLLT